MENQQNAFKSKTPSPDEIANSSVIETYAISHTSVEPIRTRIEVGEMIGRGAFGRVYKAYLNGSEEPMALKQIPFNNPRLCQRESNIMDQLRGHTNVVQLILHSCVGIGDPPTRCIILLMEYMPMTLLDYINHHSRLHQPTEALLYVRILSYQIFRGLGHLHSLGICHRDIKPGNLLLDSQTMLLKLGDFGSAIVMVPQETNLGYICTRLYRAPELFATYELYGCPVDIWSAGCVLAELMKGYPLFMSDFDNWKQLQLIVKMLGIEGLERAPEILPLCGNLSTLNSSRPSWDLLLKTPVPSDLADLLNCCLVYESAARIAPLMACAHPCYDGLRIMETRRALMPNGQHLPPLFNFSSQELSIDPKLKVQLLPLYLADMDTDFANI